MLQQDRPNDYVIATGESHSVKEFLEEAFRYQGLDWRVYVVIAPRYFRITKVDFLKGDSSKLPSPIMNGPTLAVKTDPPEVA
jgi:GDPmannose 4,6-dehydratase